MQELSVTIQIAMAKYVIKFAEHMQFNQLAICIR